MKLHSAQKGESQGFTILEVVVAMAILLLGMTVILSLLTFGAAMGRTASLRTAAANAVEAVVANLEETLFPYDPTLGTVGEPPALLERSLPGDSRVQYTARTTPNPEHSREYRVDVELSWSSAGVRRKKSFTTILLRELPFGERLRREFVERSSAPIRSLPEDK